MIHVPEEAPSTVLKAHFTLTINEAQGLDNILSKHSPTSTVLSQVVHSSADILETKIVILAGMSNTIKRGNRKCTGPLTS
jgi:hypothetical protein